MMDFADYQVKASATSLKTHIASDVVYPVLGLAGEAGEIAEKMKKIFRDKDGAISNEDRELLKKELGDVLWYVSELASRLDIKLDDVAEHNIAKLAARREQGTIHGDGDIRERPLTA